MGSLSGESKCELKGLTINRVVSFTRVFFENIKQLQRVVNGEVERVGPLASGVVEVASELESALKALKDLPGVGSIPAAVGLIGLPASCLWKYIWKKSNRNKAIQNLLRLNVGHDANLGREIIHAGSILFLSLEVPCRGFGSIFTDLIAIDFVHRLFHSMASSEEDFVMDSENIVKAVVLGESKFNGLWARFVTRKKGYDAEGFNTNKIFSKSGIVASNPNRVLVDPKDQNY